MKTAVWVKNKDLPSDGVSLSGSGNRKFPRQKQLLWKIEALFSSRSALIYAIKNKKNVFFVDTVNETDAEFSLFLNIFIKLRFHY